MSNNLIESGPERHYNPETVQFWSGLNSQSLQLQKCESCNKFQHYPRLICSHCWGIVLIFENVSGRGVVETFTDVFVSSHLRFKSMIPYRVLVVRLAEGPTVISRQFDGCTLQIGDKVTAVFSDDGRGNLLLFRAL